MTDFWTSPALPCLAGLVVFLLQIVDGWLHRRAIMRATPEQLAALVQMQRPRLLEKAGPLAVLLVVIGAGVWAYRGRALDDALARRGLPPQAAPVDRRCDPPCPRGQECWHGRCQATAGGDRAQCELHGDIEVDGRLDVSIDPADDRWRMWTQ